MFSEDSLTSPPTAPLSPPLPPPPPPPPLYLHSSELEPRPVAVELRGLNEGEVDSEGSVDGGAVDAEKDAVGARGPSRVLRSTIEANLVRRQSAQPAEHGRHVCMGFWRGGSVTGERL